MDLGDFRNMVMSQAGTSSPSFKAPSKTVLNTVIQQVLNQYAKATGCLYNEAVIFTPFVSYGDYYTFDPGTNTSGSPASPPGQANDTDFTPYLAVPMCEVDNVCLNGSWLTVCEEQVAPFGWVPGYPTGYDYRYGESSEDSVLRAFPGYLTAPYGLPVHWWTVGVNRIRFNCQFDQSYPNCWFSGKCYHQPLTGTDTQVLMLAPEDIVLCGDLTVNTIARMFGGDKSKLQAEYKAVIKPALDDRKSECALESNAQSYRGNGVAGARIDLGSNIQFGPL